MYYYNILNPSRRKISLSPLGKLGKIKYKKDLIIQITAREAPKRPNYTAAIHVYAASSAPSHTNTKWFCAPSKACSRLPIDPFASVVYDFTATSVSPCSIWKSLG